LNGILTQITDKVLQLTAMKKELNGSELAEFIKERQLHAVRGLRQSENVQPKLVIIRTNSDPVVDSYMRIKSSYGEDVEVDVDVHTIDQSEALGLIQELNSDSTVHGIIVQIPLPDKNQTDEILDSVDPEKDVDGLGKNALFDAPTPVAITWLLAGYNVELRDAKIVIVGYGRLVGKPLSKIWQSSNYDVTVADRQTVNLVELTRSADILVSATGVPALITADMVNPEAIIVDAGVATDSNGLVGDVAQDARELPEIIMTPIKGGVGPLTVAALFENVITAARKTTQSS
jgi:methylenetetrahydrofolate dehydrogenase (NADP+)/methenyltetrahydrofolate cyclohydrolase